MSEEKLRLSYSKTACFLNCRKRYHWEYIEKLTPKGKAYPLQLGDIVHKLIEKHYEGTLSLEYVQNLPNHIQELYPNNPEGLSNEIAIDAANLVLGYIKRWKGTEDFTVISNETWLEMEMDDYILYGRVDRICRTKDNRLWRKETKTTARADSAYLAGLKGGLQGSIYDYLIEHLMKEDVAGTLYDMIVKTKVPQYLRAFANKQRAMQDLALKTIEGVVKDIKGGDFYPSCNCFNYNSECPFKPLCIYDSPETRKAFYEPRVSFFDEIPEGKEVKKI